MHAVETVYHAALAHQYYELTAGSREIDGHQFTWVTYPNKICVSYLNNAKEIDKCIHF